MFVISFLQEEAEARVEGSESRETAFVFYASLSRIDTNTQNSTRSRFPVASHLQAGRRAQTSHVTFEQKSSKRVQKHRLQNKCGVHGGKLVRDPWD